MSLTDEQLMQRVRQGELTLFDALVERYRPALVRVAWSKLGDGAAAEDVVQEALLAAFAARRTYKPTFAFRTWLWTILLNLCRRQVKRRQASSTPISNAAPKSPEPFSLETGLSVALRTEQRERLHAELARLPEVQADALRLRFFAGLKFEDIAAAMECSLGTAKLRVRNGLLALAERLREDGEGS